MSIPAEIPDIGSTGQRLSQNPRFDPMKAGFGTEEYFVWSRFDGATSLKDLLLMTGLPIERGIAIVRKLRQVGAILLPGEPGAPPAPTTSSGPRMPAPAPPRTRTGPVSAPPTEPPRTKTGPTPEAPRTRTGPLPAAGRTRTGPTPGTPVTPPGTASGPRVASGTGPAPTTSPIPVTPGLAAGTRPRASTLAPADSRGISAPLPELDAPTAAEAAALAEPSDLPESDRRRILVGLRLVANRDPWALLGVARGSDKRALKRAFFERSKIFHPDRYFGRHAGSFKARLHVVFEAITTAHEELTDDNAGRRNKPEAATAPQTPAEYAAELFDRACVAEVSGDHGQALKLFAAAVKLDAQARYLRRAASCALAANELRAAEDYAKKAAALEGSDPSTARILARVLRALGKLDDAEEVLIMALAMKNENDTLAAELRSDLRLVREQLRR